MVQKDFLNPLVQPQRQMYFQKNRIIKNIHRWDRQEMPQVFKTC